MNRRHLRTATLALLATGLSAGVAQAAVTVPDSSFETPATSGYVYNPTVAGVTFNGGSGVQRNGSDWGFAAAPDGVQTAFIQSGTGGIGQIVFALTGLVIGQGYTVDFSASARPGYAPNIFTVALNGATLGTFNVTTPRWATYTTAAFVADATIASLSFTGSATTNGDNDVGLDRVNVAAVPEPATWALLLLGFGGMGYTLRRRASPARIRFA